MSTLTAALVVVGVALAAAVVGPSAKRWQRARNVAASSFPSQMRALNKVILDTAPPSAHEPIPVSKC
eukprot:6205530-Pleurochrysis_carterae.AAC.1